MKNKLFLILSSIIACSILFLIEQVLNTGYTVKTLSKVIIFTGLPLYFIYFRNKSNLYTQLQFKSFRISELKLGFIFGISVFIIISIGYFIFKDIIDFEGIVVSMNSKGITKNNFVFIATYICIGNSVLEEFFFRGYVFLNLRQYREKFAYLFSSILFALYHIGIFLTWFNLGIMSLALLGLVVGALFFNYLCTKSNNFLNSWLVHFFADFAIIIVGFRILSLYS